MRLNALSTSHRQNRLRARRSARKSAPPTGGRGWVPAQIGVAYSGLARWRNDRLPEQSGPMSIMRSRTISVGVARDPQSVYDFITDPRTLPQWAPGFANSMHESAGDWIVETTVGPVRIEFVERNELGVADHRVTIKPGADRRGRPRCRGRGCRRRRHGRGDRGGVPDPGQRGPALRAVRAAGWPLRRW